MTHRLHKIADAMLRHVDLIVVTIGVHGAIEATRDCIDDDGVRRHNQEDGTTTFCPWNKVIGVFARVGADPTLSPMPGAKPKLGLLRGGKED